MHKARAGLGRTIRLRPSRVKSQMIIGSDDMAHTLVK